MNKKSYPQTFVVGILNSDKAPTIQQAPAFIENDAYRALVHYSPLCELRDTSVEANSDVIVDFGCDYGDISLMEATGERYVPVIKFSKGMQLLKIQNAINKVPSELRQFIEPVGLYGRIESIDSFSTYRDTTGSVPSHDMYVIKPGYGANGENQVLIGGDDIHNFLTMMTVVRSDEELASLFPKAVFTPRLDTNSEFKNGVYQPFFHNLHLVITRYIPNVVSEYRVLVSGFGKNAFHYFYQREIKEGAYPQANLEINDTMSLKIGIPISGLPIPDCKEASILVTHLTDLVTHLDLLKDALDSLLKNLDIGFGSVDVFFTAEGKVGIFEYSNEFGYVGIPSHFIRMISSRFIHQVIAKANLV